ncbi:NAD(P)-binding protein [Imleria badia]|nr:NAD(P)-binding protein [Imleria badia]
MASVVGFLKRNNAAFFSPPTSGAPSNSTPLKFGILGAARIAPPALITPAKSHPEVEVYAVAARDLNRAEKFAKKYGIKKWYGGQNGYNDLLHDDEIDIIYNPLPNGLHYEWTMKALAAGKHVLVEKPSGNTAEETRRMVEFANQKGLVLLEAFHYRFHPAIQRVKQIIDSGELGAVKEIYAALCLSKGFIAEDDIRMDYDIGGGALMDCGCYPLSCVRYLAKSDPTAVISASAVKFHKDARIDTATSATLLFPPSSPGEEPVKVTIRCDFSLPNILGFIPRWPDVSVRAVCEQGSVELFNFPQPVIYHNIKVSPAGGKTRTEKAYKFLPSSGLKGEEWWSTYRYQLEAVVDQVRGRTPNSWVTSEDSVANMEWIEKIYEASGLGSRPQSSFQLPSTE